MAYRVLMPQAGQSMTEGKIVRWLVAEGSAVRRGDPLLEIETDKANMEVESVADGVLRKVFHREGEVVPVLTPVAVVAAASETPDLAALARPDGAGEAQAPPPPAPVPGDDLRGGVTASAAAGGATTDGGTAGTVNGGRVAASPLARRLAARNRIDLRRLRGSGPRGRIIRRDVEA